MCADFDNIWNALTSLFYLATTEGWVDIMHSGMDCPRAWEMHPERDRCAKLSLFFLAFEFIGATFSMSLFIGVLVTYFSEHSGSGLLTKSQQQWVHTKLLVHENSGTHPRSLDENDHNIRHVCRKLVQSENYQRASGEPRQHFCFSRCAVICRQLATGRSTNTVCLRASAAVLMFNVVFILLVEFPVQGWVEDSQAYVNNGCLVYYTMEVVLGLIGLGTAYLHDSWNQFDVVIVLLSWVAAIGSSLPVTIQVVRAVRVLRIIVLMKGMRSLKALFVTLVMTAGAIVNIGMLMLIVFFIFGVTGMHLFGGLESVHLADVHGGNPFVSTWKAMHLLFEVATGHAFLELIHAIENSDGAISGAPRMFFISFYLIANWLLVQLFIAVLLENVQLTLANEFASIDSEHAARFRVLWIEHTPYPHKDCSLNDLAEVVKHMEEPFDKLREISYFYNRLIIELMPDHPHPLGVCRTKKRVTFGNVLMSLAVLYLSNDCLPYKLQRQRTGAIVAAQQTYATRLIAVAYRKHTQITKTPLTWTTPFGTVIQLDSASQKQKYVALVKAFFNIQFRAVVNNNKLFDFKHEVSVHSHAHRRTGRVKLKVAWEPIFDTTVNRYQPVRFTMTVQVQRCSELRRMDVLQNDVYVTVRVPSTVDHDTASTPNAFDSVPAPASAASGLTNTFRRFGRTDVIDGGGKRCDFTKTEEMIQSSTFVFEWTTTELLEDPPVTLQVDVFDEDGDSMIDTITTPRMTAAPADTDDLIGGLSMPFNNIGWHERWDKSWSRERWFDLHAISIDGQAEHLMEQLEAIAEQQQGSPTSQSRAASMMNGALDIGRKGVLGALQVGVTGVTAAANVAKKGMELIPGQPVVKEEPLNPRYCVMHSKVVVRVGADIRKTRVRGFLREGDIIEHLPDAPDGLSVQVVRDGTRAMMHGPAARTLKRLYVRRLFGVRGDVSNIAGALEGWVSEFDIQGRVLIQLVPHSRLDRPSVELLPTRAGADDTPGAGRVFNDDAADAEATE